MEDIVIIGSGIAGYSAAICLNQFLCPYKLISGNYIGIGKYGITCCAADAGFVGFLSKLGNHKVKVNKWY